MTTRILFSRRVLDALPTPATGRAYVYDTKASGLILCVTDHGAKSFQVYRKLNGRPLRITLGRYPDLSIDHARRKAAEALALLADGINPLVEKKAKVARRLTLAQVFDAYLNGRDLKPRTVAIYQRVFAHDFADWRTMPIVDITRDMVEQRHTELGAHSRAHANLALRILRAVLNFAAGKYEACRGQPLLLDNPTKRLSATRSWYRIDRRQSVVKSWQFPAWFKAINKLANSAECNSPPATVRDYLLLLLFTGLRRNEAARLRWSDIDLEHRTLRVTDTKNRQPHELPLSHFLFELLTRRKHAQPTAEYVFSYPNQAGYLTDTRPWSKQVIQQSNVKFMLHDLRRSFITVAESLEISSYMLKRLLNHKTAGDVTAGYIVFDVERLREPMQKITDAILNFAGLSTAR